MRALVAGVVLVLLLGSAAGARDSILGEWRGTSICVNRKVAPACRDESVVYRFTAAKKDTVHQAAYKIVAGEEQLMGEADFTRRESLWVSEFHSPRYHGRWSFRVADTLLTGTLVDVPTGAVVRRVRAVRQRNH